MNLSRKGTPDRPRGTNSAPRCLQRRRFLQTAFGMTVLMGGSVVREGQAQQLVYDQNGNPFMVNQDGSLTPMQPSTSGAVPSSAYYPTGVHGQSRCVARRTARRTTRRRDDDWGDEVFD